MGNVLYDVLKGTLQKAGSFADLGGVLSDKIEVLHKEGVDTQYLVEVKKGVLALGDFLCTLSVDEITETLSGFDLISHLSDHVKSGLEEKMSAAEKLSFKAFHATKRFNESAQNISIIREEPEAVNDNVSNIIDITTLPQMQRKASWLQTAFGDNAEDGAPEAEGDEVDCRDSRGLVLKYG